MNYASDNTRQKKQVGKISDDRQRDEED